MHNRLKIWIEAKGLKSSEFADNIGVNRATISHIISGRNKPSIDFLRKLLNFYPELNSNWLITGEGSMNVKSNIKEKESLPNISKIVVFYDDKSFDELNS